MFWRVLSIRMWCLGLLLVVGLGVVFYLVLIRGTETITTQQLLDREQIIARAEANNVATFFQAFGDSIAILAHLATMEGRDTKTVQDLDIFVEQWKGSDLISELVGGVVLTDRNGVVTLNSDVLGIREVGISLADRDYFLWAKNNPEEGSYFVGELVMNRLGATKGQLIIPVAAPLYQKGLFTGVATAFVKLQPLIDRYLKVIEASDLTEIYIIDKEGKLLYSPVSDVVGLNISEVLGDNIKNVLDTAKEGKLRVTLNSKSGEPEDHLLSYSPISLGDKNWLLMRLSTNKIIEDITVPIQIRQTVILILVSLSILLFGILVARENKSQKSL